ncbi:MAG: CHAT domain-containing protein [Cyanobacteria bacterium P01_G01_bin.54]
MLKQPLWMGGAILSALALPCPALAQSILPAADGTGTIISYNGNTYHIHGGTQAGANLFHSFQALGLNPGEIANFLSNPSITHILGRVTGGDPSVIEGLIQVTGANSNLYLMNPAGLIFGQGASLNVGGDFVATTADRIAVGEGWFVSQGLNDYNSLVGTPNQFAFASETPGAIVNFGDLSNTQNVSLVGGTVINQGQVVSSAGTVMIAAVPGERFVKISQPGMLLSLEVPTEAIAAEINPIDLPTLLTGSGETVNASVQSGDVIIAGEVQGQQVDLYAAGQVKQTETDLVAGDTRVIRFSETGENPDQAMFIDARADNLEALLYGAAAGTVSQIIERDENGIAVISEQLSVISESVGDLESVAIVAEGNDGNFWLGNQWIRTENLGDYAAQLQTWSAALTESADILLYSCFTALGAAGKALVQGIADLTGADVAASVNATGSANYSGDWVLETRTGAIEAGNPFTAATLADWEGKLTTLTVMNIADSGDGSLRHAIETLAGAGDLINFDTTGVFATAQTITLSGGEIAIAAAKDNLTIEGTGQNQLTIDGNHNDRVFSVFTDNITIQDLTIQNGSINTDEGGGIRFNGSGTLRIENSTITGNTAFNGGGIYTREEAGTLIVENSIISHNRSISPYLEGGGGIFSKGQSTSIRNSTISGNNSANNGGAIHIIGSSPSTLVIDNSTIANNTTQNVGTIQFDNSLGSVMISDSTFYGNSAAFYGGAINTNAELNVDNTTITSNTAGKRGGGVSNSLGNTTISHSIITNNRTTNPTQYGGGGIYFNDGGLGGTLTIENSVIAGNRSANRGGGIFGNSGSIAVTNSTLSGNLAGAGGDGIYSEKGSVNLANSGDLNLTDSILTVAEEGDVSLTGNNINLLTGIQSEGGDIVINAGSAVTALTADATISSSGDTGGNITITAGSDLNLRNLIAAGLNGDGGDITITSTGGLVNTTFGGSEGLLNSSANNGNAGNVSVSTIGAMTLGKIFAESIGGAGGSVNLESSSLVRLTGTSNGVFGTANASISTAGSSAGGTITIRHGGLGVVPFTIGNASSNGSAGSLSTGNSAGQTLSPTQSFLFDFSQGGIQILSTTAPVPLALPTPGSNPSPLLFGDKSPVELLVETIGDQLGATTTIDVETNKFAWTIPGETQAITGNLPMTAGEIDIAAIDEQLEGEYEQYFGAEFDTEAAGVTVASIREMLAEIEAETGTRPVLIYALSYPESLELLLITPQDDPIVREIVPDATFSQLRSKIQQFNRRVQFPGSHRYLGFAQQLHTWLIEPLQDELAGYEVDTLLFAMSAGLRALPLAALHDGEQFLVEQYSLGQIPSVSLTDGRYRSLQNAPVVAMGASQFQEHHPLPAVPMELTSITQRHPASQQFLNEAFTLGNFQAESQDDRQPILHLATHSRFQAGRSDLTYIQLWDQPIGLADLRTLDWHSTTQLELLVLSACETALGDLDAELGFAGLAVQTGVKSAIASLWQVSDLGTLALMDRFYAQLANPAIPIKAEALRQAQLAMLRGELSFQDGTLDGMPLTPELARYSNTDLTHPFYWSAFTLVGSPW